jgi:transposase-like protein
MFLMVGQKVGISAKNFQRMMGLSSYQTAWTWLHKLRLAMVRKQRPKLHGRVEIDEAFIGGVAQGKSGRGSLNPMAVIAVEREKKGLGRVRMQVIDDASAATLKPFIEANVEKGSTAHTDGWQGYANLDINGFKHAVKVASKPATASQLLPGVHRVISLVKRWLLGIHQGAVRPHHLQAYLDEYGFRFNRRRSSNPVKLFHRLAQQLVITPPTSYAKLAGRTPPPVVGT